ncbi:MAG: GAF domain-containing protein [Leptospiraceae bacterium]|nr:GAF domain-containing protein [Leptospiraceae bacterium]MCP5503121.1 GAF domain-containing protein [Leptospiraceae bacterium]
MPFENFETLSDTNTEEFIKIIFYIKEETVQKEHKWIRDILKKHLTLLILFIINAPMDKDILEGTGLENDLFFSNVESTVPDIFLARTFINAATNLELRIESFKLRYKVNISSNHISKLTKIGISLASERDFNKLLKDILYSAREISHADGGSLYLVEKDEMGNPRNLRFKVSAMDLNSTEFIMSINKESIAGYVASTGEQLNIEDAYHLPPDAHFRFNKEYDKLKGYYTKSMLTVPMKNYRNEVVGVIQLINRKKNFHQKLTLEQMKTETLPFDKYSEGLVMSVAGQATVAIENNNLLNDIESLFEGFVTASVSAIEARDPTTSGHSFRVAELTVGLAEIVDSLNEGRFKDLKFSREQMKEIRYASLLHDFGKVGVREKVLVKAKKLEESELEIIKWRFRYLIKELELRFTKKKLDYLNKHGESTYADYSKSIDLEYFLEKEKLEKFLHVIHTSNEPTILEQSNSAILEQIAKLSYDLPERKNLKLLTDEEFNFLSIKKGSLDFEERREIESHVEHTYQFLSKIPWTGELKMVPSIAHAHHEKLNGTGYPRGLVDYEIPVQSKMMTIADIFDALTDKDRPYKKAVPLERALDILHMEVKDNHIDSDLLNIFIHAKVYERIKK